MNVFVLSLLSKLTTTVDIAHTGETRSRLVCFDFFVETMNLSAGEFVFCAVSTMLSQFSAMAALCRTSYLTPSLTI